MIVSDLPETFLRVFALAFGLVWGSFLNVVIHRVPRGMSVAHPGSHCPHCGTAIKPQWNIPVLSWLVLRGRARCCQARISVRYPLVELAGGVLSLAVLETGVVPLDPQTPMIHAVAIYLAGLALALGLVAAAFIDLEHMIVPDAISIGGTVLGLGTFALRDMTLLDAAIGAAVGFLVVWLPFDVLYARLRGHAGMGLGDAKLLMLAGAWFGWPGALFVLCAGALQGTAAALIMTLAGKRLDEPEAVKRERAELEAQLASLHGDERAQLEAAMATDPLATAPEEGWAKTRIAFGPFLILATLECLLLGRDRILAWLLWS